MERCKGCGSELTVSEQVQGYKNYCTACNEIITYNDHMILIHNAVRELKRDQYKGHVIDMSSGSLTTRQDAIEMDRSR
jgi:hypothetical protein